MPFEQPNKQCGDTTLNVHAKPIKNMEGRF